MTAPTFCPHCRARFSTTLALAQHLRDDGDTGRRCIALRRPAR